MRVALLSGLIAGSLLFGYQYFVIVPRIAAAEALEQHDDADHWKPQVGTERTAFTAASTILTGIALAAVLVAFASLTGSGLDVHRGLLWGVAGFACFVAAPALGLPSEPPGVPAADVGARQLWWAFTAAASALGLWLIVMSRQGRVVRAVGSILIVLPHVIGAPQATGPQVIPAALVRDFAIASIVGNGLFWIVAGAAAGWLQARRHSP